MISKPACPTKSQQASWTPKDWALYNRQMAEYERQQELTPERMLERIEDLERQVEVLVEIVKKLASPKP